MLRGYRTALRISHQVIHAVMSMARGSPHASNRRAWQHPALLALPHGLIPSRDSQLWHAADLAAIMDRMPDPAPMSSTRTACAPAARLMVDRAPNGLIIGRIPPHVLHHVEVPARDVRVPGPPRAAWLGGEVQLPGVLPHSYLHGLALRSREKEQRISVPNNDVIDCRS